MSITGPRHLSSVPDLGAVGSSLGVGVRRLLASHVGDEEDDAEHYAQSANNDVADSQEVVGASEHVRGGEDEVLAASEGAHIVVVHDLQLVLALGHVAFDHAVQLAEVGQTSRTHPDNEVGIGDILPLDLVPCGLVDVLELVVDVGLPCDVLGLDFDRGAFRVR